MTDKTPVKIVIALDWSMSPTGRYERDGESNATAFKKRFILDNLKAGENFFIDLDGTDGYGSSFLDEAFAGLVRDNLIAKEEFFQRFTFKSDEDPSFIEEIKSYIDETN